MNDFERTPRDWRRMVSPALVLAMFCGLSACGDRAQNPQKKPEGGDRDTGASQSRPESGSKGSQGTDPEEGPEKGKAGDAGSCESQEDRQCVAKIPKGWSGPVQPQKADSIDELADCDGASVIASGAGPDASKNIYVAEVQAPKARCGSCTVNLELGSCGPASLQRRFVDPEITSKCLKFDEQGPKHEIGAGCERVSGEGLSAGRIALGLRPGSSNRDKAACSLGRAPKAEIEAPTFPEFYRLCQAKPHKGSCEEGESCFAFEQAQVAPREPKVCIYHEGDADCPRGYSESSMVLYGQAKDERGCSECEIEHKVGEIVCEHDVGLSARDKDLRCTQPRKVAGKDLCMTEEEFLGREAPWGVVEQDRRTSYTGSCSAKDPKPQGELRLEAPITVCCASF